MLRCNLHRYVTSYMRESLPAAARHIHNSYHVSQNTETTYTIQSTVSLQTVNQYGQWRMDLALDLGRRSSLDGVQYCSLYPAVAGTMVHDTVSIGVSAYGNRKSGGNISHDRTHLRSVIIPYDTYRQY